MLLYTVYCYYIHIYYMHFYWIQYLMYPPLFCPDVFCPVFLLYRRRGVCNCTNDWRGCVVQVRECETCNLFLRAGEYCSLNFVCLLWNLSVFRVCSEFMGSRRTVARLVTEPCMIENSRLSLSSLLFKSGWRFYCKYIIVLLTSHISPLYLFIFFFPFSLNRDLWRVHLPRLCHRTLITCT